MIITYVKLYKLAVNITAFNSYPINRKISTNKTRIQNSNAIAPNNKWPISLSPSSFL